MPRSEAVIQLSGTHLGASTTDEALGNEAAAAQLSVGQTLDLATDIGLDYLPEVENFDVQLKKDSQGLGITIAGYVCERGTSVRPSVSFPRRCLISQEKIDLCRGAVGHFREKYQPGQRGGPFRPDSDQRSDR